MNYESVVLNQRMIGQCLETFLFVTAWAEARYCTGVQRVEDKDATNHPFPPKNCPALNVGSAKVNIFLKANWKAC